MSILFSKRTKGIIKWVWGFIAILIIASMVFTYSGGMALFS
jgi:hypothetical protein